MSELTTGRCLCGSVSYTVTGKPLRMAQCHCVDCQRASGDGHISNAFFSPDDVKISGELAEFTVEADSGNQLTRKFCPKCGSRLFGVNSANPAVMSLAVGTAEDKSWFKPDVIIYGKNRPKWDLVDENVPTFDEMPPSK